MKVLLVAATEFEVNLSDLQSNKNSGVEIDVLISGVGIASTIYFVTKKLMQSKYDLAVQAGIAGSFTNELSLGEVVFINADTFGDLGTEEMGVFKSLFETKLVDQNDSPFTNGWLINNHQLLNDGLLKSVKGITVNRITDNKNQIEQQKNIFGAQAESMEGAAFHYACLQMNTSFLQLRGISNAVGERDKNKWKMREAIDNLNSELNKIIQVLS